MEKRQRTRRNFIKDTGYYVVSGSLITGLAGCDSGANDEDNGNPGFEEDTARGLTLQGNELTIDLTVQNALTQAGGFLLVSRVGSSSVRAVVVNTDGATFKAFTSICTHEQCDISSYNSGTQELRCPCHGSTFDLDGNVSGGPANGPISEFSVTRSGDTIRVSVG